MESASMMLALPKMEDIRNISIETIMETPYQFDLELIAARLPDVEATLLQNSLSVRMANYPHIVLHVTEDGLIILAGTKTMAETKLVFTHIVSFIQRTFLPELQFNEDKMIYNISGALDIGYQIAIKELHDYSVFKTQYHPDGLFVNLKIEEPKMKFSIHASGKINFNCCKQMDHIALGLMVIIPILYTYRVDNDLQTSVKIETPMEQQED